MGATLIMVMGIPVRSIIPPATDHTVRKVGIEQLAESIKAVGLINPLTVKQVGKNKYEIVAGRRRFWACLEAGIENINCNIIDPEDHIHADVIEVTENLHRVQLTPMQEAEAIKKLRDLGHDDPSIAADLGMTRQFVARRAKLLDLSGEWKKALTKPVTIRYSESAVHLWPVARLEMIARYPEDKQDSLFDQLGLDAMMTVEDLKSELASDESKLSAAIWDLQDATLCAAAGSCADCPKRAGAQPLLFSDAADPVIGLNKDTCLDKKCWGQKHKAFIERKVKEKQKEHPDLVKITTGAARGHTLGSYQYDEAKKDDKGAVPALRVDGPKAGSITYVKVKKNQITRTSGGPKQEKTKSPAQMAKEREDRRWGVVLEAISDALAGPSQFGRSKNKGESKAKSLVLSGTPIEMLRFIAALTVFAEDPNLGIKGGISLLNKSKDMAAEELAGLVWSAIRLHLSRNFNVWDCQKISKDERFKADLQVYLDLIEVNFDDLWAKAIKEVPEPKAEIAPEPKTPAKSAKSSTVKPSAKSAKPSKKKSKTRQDREESLG